MDARFRFCCAFFNLREEFVDDLVEVRNEAF